MARQLEPLRFPLSLSFKIIAVAPQISVTDASGSLIAYVRQKMFRLKEAVTVYSDREQTREAYRIAADRVIDFSAQYHIEDASGTRIGVVRRRGVRSIWRAHYEIARNGQPLMEIREENPMTKVADNIFGGLPLIGILSGYLFHPAYRITYVGSGALLLRVAKQPALWEGRYTLEKAGGGEPEDERLALLSTVMMLLLERTRG
jgi:uncharacterized protein YxjI